MQMIMNSPEQRQLIWSRRLALMDHESQMKSERAEGIEEGETRLGKLIKCLLPLGRLDDVDKVAGDEQYRKKLYIEFGI